MYSILMLLENPFISDSRVEREIASLTSAGYKVILICWDRDKTYPLNETRLNGLLTISRVHYFAKRGKGPFYLFRKYFMMNLLLIRFGLKQQFDIIHSHNIETILAGKILKLIKKKALIYDAHEIIGIFHYRLPKLLNEFTAIAERWLAKSADAIIVVTPGMKQLFIERGYKNSIHSIENFPLKNLFDFERNGFNNGNKITIGRIGTISKFINPRLMIEAVNELNKNNITCSLIFAGVISLDFDSEFLSLIEEHKTFCEYWGIIPTNKIADVYQQIDISLNVPDTMKEFKYGFSSKLFESMAAGIPVIHSNIGETQNVIEDSGCGIILDNLNLNSVTESLRLLLCNSNLRNQMGQRGRKAFLDTYNWENVSSKLIQIYKNILN